MDEIGLRCGILWIRQCTCPTE